MAWLFRWPLPFGLPIDFPKYPYGLFGLAHDHSDLARKVRVDKVLVRPFRGLLNISFAFQPLDNVLGLWSLRQCCPLFECV